jgi:hypothetical protein
MISVMEGGRPVLRPTGNVPLGSRNLGEAELAPHLYGPGQERTVHAPRALGRLATRVARPYGIALVLVAAALALTLLLRGLFPYPFLFLFFAAVMASA